MINGALCSKHPELAGRRHNSRNCPGCVADRRRVVPELARASNKRWRDANRVQIRADQKEWRDANPAKIRANNLKRMGFTIELFERAAKAQRGKCAICQCLLKGLPTKQIHADHEHTTITPRGVLCHHCNTGLGVFRDSPEHLINAAWYLINPTLQGEKK